MSSLDTSSLPAAAILASKVASADYARAARAIVSAADDGRTSVTVQGQLDEPVTKALRAKGYRVTFQSDQREGDYTEISFS